FLHPQRHHGLVVKGFHACGVLRHSVENGINHGLRGLGRASRHNFLHALAPEEFAVMILRVEDTVAEEYENVSGMSFETELVVIRILKQTEWQASRLDDFRFAVVTVDRAR